MNKTVSTIIPAFNAAEPFACAEDRVMEQPCPAVKVSIIVPVYNVQHFLPRSVESLLQQTLTDLEIILVNDGSMDDSLSVCKKFAEKDARIIVVDKPNGGVSSARNAGLRVARGDYIGFIDPDDWIEPPMYEQMLKDIETAKADVCFCDYWEEVATGTISRRIGAEKPVMGLDDLRRAFIPRLVGRRTLGDKERPVMGSVWSALFSSPFVKESGLVFDESVAVREDLLFLIHLLPLAKRVCFVDQCYYHYVQHDASAVNAYNKDYFDHLLFVSEKLEAALDGHGLLEGDVLRRLDNRFALTVFSSFKNELKKSAGRKFSDSVSFIRRVCNTPKVRAVFSPSRLSGGNVFRRSALYAIRGKCVLYLFFHYKAFHVLRSLRRRMRRLL